MELEPTKRADGLASRFVPILTVLAVCWLVFVVNNLFLHGSFTRFGIVPRHLAGLPGILWSPFLHASFSHLAANTLPLLVLGGVLCARSRTEFTTVAALGTLLAGGITWLIGRSAYHIGASALIFCFFGYLASLAIFRRSIGTLLLSAACIIGYGGILRGLLPGSITISWEGHLAGLISGIALAWASSRMRTKAPNAVPAMAPQAVSYPLNRPGLE